ncbi:MAG: ZinT/AdcA family metal-binding protein, partial [Spirochaetaceae bacterium]|nr:ZinT/AdcA family metal-binding protein [Spirochaetaceae bacterium]
MKRMMLFIGVLLALSMMVYARGQGARQKGDGTIQVVATIFPPYDFVREVAGDRVKLSMLLPPGAESHSFEPTPRDMVTLQNCDVFIYGGGDSDAWVDRVLESVDTAKMRIIRMMDVVDVVEEEIVEGMEDDDHDHAEEAFTQEEVQDRPLSDWAGEWQSVYPALLEGTLKPVMEHKAEEGDKTAAEYYEQYKTAYMTDLDKLVITQNDITFYRKDVPVRARYAYKGAAITPRDEGLWVRYQFEVVGEPSAGAPRYIMFSDHLHAPAKSEHFHLYSSDESFDALLKDTHPVHYPTYYPAD